MSICLISIGTATTCSFTPELNILGDYCVDNDEYDNDNDDDDNDNEDDDNDDDDDDDSDDHDSDYDNNLTC